MLELPVLKDRNVFPDENVIASHIGSHMLQWHSFLGSIRSIFPGSEEVWNYYNDGKSWLFRVILKKKTLFWMTVIEGTFKITFYFGEKARPQIEAGSIPDHLKDQFLNGKSYGKIKAITIRVEGEKDINDALAVAGIKAKIR